MSEVKEIDEIDALYRRVQRLAILTRCNPDEPAFAAAYWKAVAELREQDRRRQRPERTVEPEAEA